VKKTLAVLSLVRGAVLMCKLLERWPSPEMRLVPNPRHNPASTATLGCRCDETLACLRPVLRNSRRSMMRSKEYADAWGNMKDDQALSLINRAFGG
jgi:hypothetical protein